MIEVVTEFLPEATVRTRAYVYDDDGDLVDPSSAHIEILKEGATVVASTAMSNSATGIYDHYYNLPSTASDWYSSRVKITDGTGASAKYSKSEVSFRAKE